MALVDTHCHLDFDQFETDRRQVVERAAKAGVIKIVNPGVDVGSSTCACKLAKQFPQVFAAVGVHPNSSAAWQDSVLADLEVLVQQPKVVGIGEIGLDYYRDHSPHATQRKAFLAQLTLAAKLELPVIVHSRASNDDVVAILIAWQEQLVKAGSLLAQRPGVLHSYSGDLRQAHELIASNFFIGISGPVTFKNAQELQELVRGLPLAHILIETDAPFLSPHPFRSRRNEPERVKLVAEQIAALHEMTVPALAEITTANANRLFFWDRV